MVRVKAVLQLGNSFSYFFWPTRSENQAAICHCSKHVSQSSEFPDLVSKEPNKLLNDSAVLENCLFGDRK